MATFKELAVLIAEPLGRELDEPFKAQIAARIKYWRAKLLKDSLNKNPKDRQYFTQRITIKLSEVSAVDCGIDLDCTFMRSEEIPNIVRANGILFDFIGSVDGSTPFRMIKRWELPYHLSSKYSPKVTTFAAWENKRILLPGNRLIEWVSIEAIFDDPEAAHNMDCSGECTECATEECEFEDSEYPINEDLAQQIVQYILQVDFNRQPPTDDKTEVHVDSSKTE
jgi:hypothetical protein